MCPRPSNESGMQPRRPRAGSSASAHSYEADPTNRPRGHVCNLDAPQRFNTEARAFLRPPPDLTSRPSSSWNSHLRPVIVVSHAPARGRGRRQDGGARAPRAHRGGRRRGRGAQWRGRALDGGCRGLRRARARRDAPGDRRLRDLPAAARRRRLDAGAAAHRAGLGRGPGGRARRRGGRLPHKAVLLRRAVGTAAGAGAPRPEGAARGARGGRAAARPGHPPGLARPAQHRAVHQGVRAAGGVHAPPRRRAEPAGAARACLGLRLREPLERDRRVRALPAREDRPPVRRAEHRDGTRRRLPAARGRRRELNRLPVRTRLTLAFTAVMAVVLLAVGLFVYTQVGSDLEAALDTSLRSRADDIAAVADSGGLGSADQDRLVARDESLAQVIGSDGSVVYSSPGLGDRPLLRGDQLARAEHGQVFVDRDSVARFDERVRLLARPTESRVVVVGATREDRDEALASLGTVLLTGGPIALLLAALAGYGLASAALRPVGAMRGEAAEISRLGSGRRLPLPPAGDELSKLGGGPEEMLERLEKSAERERGFVASASHELRTPLALLKAELEPALREGRSEEELRAALASAAVESDRLVQLAEDLLVLARADEGKLPVRPERLDIGELLRGSARRFEARAAEEHRELVVRPSSALSLDADRLRVEQALANLVDNALRHGGGPIELSAERDGERVRLHVLDRGPGFEASLDGSAFERFTRGDRARARGGTGLGLAIVEAIARSHAGRAGTDPREGGGADVWLELPAVTSASRSARR